MKTTRSNVRLLLGDCCLTELCEKAWAAGAPACYPYSWQENQGSLVARYVCYRCGRTWNCSWSRLMTDFDYDLSDEAITISMTAHGQTFPKRESPVEKIFWIIGKDFIPRLTPQVNIGPYRADFAIPDLRIVIEIDGIEFHASDRQVSRDMKRDDYIRQQGWQVLRFTGSEVKRDVSLCVLTVLDVVASRYRLRDVGVPSYQPMLQEEPVDSSAT